MINLKEVLADCISYDQELEWFEFKSNYLPVDELGEYISALANTAAFLCRKYAYLFFGVDDKTHKVKGTTFEFNQLINGEPLQHYLARLLSPSIAFSFEEIIYDGKRVVALIIPPAKTIPVSYKNIRYQRIGSSKVDLKRYPERESKLFSILTFGEPTILTIEAPYQDLTFSQLFVYFASKGIALKEENFETNLSLRNKDGKYNFLAQLLSDNSHIPIRVAIFEGEDKASRLESVKEFGYKCLLYSLDDVLKYGEVLNIIKCDETHRVVERLDIPMFDQDAFREAIINAFVHNRWIDRNEPMIAFFSDRVEILSRGSLHPLQTKTGFFKGNSIPINEKLSEILLRLHISEKNGRGVPTIKRIYGEGVFEFDDNAIRVKIPYKFNRESAFFIRDKTDKDVHNKMHNIIYKNLHNKMHNKNLKKIRERIYEKIKEYPYISIYELSLIFSVSMGLVAKIQKTLKEEKSIERVGSRKNGYWRINDKNLANNKNNYVHNKMNNNLHNKNINEMAIKIFKKIKEYPSITIRELSLIFSISPRLVSEIEKNLKKEGIIERVGSRKGGYWKINEKKIYENVAKSTK